MPREIALGSSPGHWLTLQEAADHCRISRPTLERALRAGRGPRAYRSGMKRLVFDVRDLDAWLRGQEVAGR